MDLIRNPYTSCHIFLDIIVALFQILETSCNILYFLTFNFSYNVLYYLSFVFLCLNPLTQFLYANYRLCSFGGSFKLFKCFQKNGFFYEKIKISDFGYFSKITAHTSDIVLCFLYLFAPVVLAVVFVALLINMGYVILSWALSSFIYLSFIGFISILSTFFCVIKMDLFLYPACTEVVGFFYFIGDNKAHVTNGKMLYIKKICMVLQIFFQTIPLLIIFIMNNLEMSYFSTDSLFKLVVVYLQIGLAAANIFFTFSHIISLAKYGKIISLTYEQILRQTTIQKIPAELSKKDTEIIIIQSLDAIPNK